MGKHTQLENFIFSRPRSRLPKSQHIVRFVRKRKNGTPWVLKSLEKNRFEAVAETISQEFFRLIYPFYPKTRWFLEKGCLYVLSKKISGFDVSFFSESDTHRHRLRDNYSLVESGEVTGLVAAQVLSLLVNEVDFRAANVGKDPNGKIIKIDGGLSFACCNEGYNWLVSDRNFNLTKKDLDALPAIHNYAPVNWLDLIQWRGTVPQFPVSSKQGSCLSALATRSPPYFKQERNKALLLIDVLPAEVVYHFVQSYVPDKGLAYDKKLVAYVEKLAYSLADFILERQATLHRIAKQLEGYVEYVASAQGQNDIVEYVGRLKRFTTMGKAYLLQGTQEAFHFFPAEYIFEHHINGYLPIKEFCRLLRDSLAQLAILWRVARSEPLCIPDSAQTLYEALCDLQVVIKDYLLSPVPMKLKTVEGKLHVVKKSLEGCDVSADHSLQTSIKGLLKQLATAQGQSSPIPLPNPVGDRTVCQDERPINLQYLQRVCSF